MSANYMVQGIYDSEIGEVTSSARKWQDVLKLAGQLYRYEFDNIIMIHAQRPSSTLVADYDTWKKVGRFVKRGSKGIAIFPSRALNPRMRYVFDIKDTGGRNQKLTWDLEGDNLNKYLDFLVSQGKIEQCEQNDRESLENSLKLFTGTNVWYIIRTDFEDRISELTQLTGSVIKEFNEKRESLQLNDNIEQLVYQSIMYAVGTRCGFDLSVQEQDFSQIVNIKDEEIVYRLGSLVCDVSCSVLREFSRNLKIIEKQPNKAYERRTAYGSRNDLSRSGGTFVSRYPGTTESGAGITEPRQIRKNDNEVFEREREEPFQLTLPIREVSREDESSRRGGKSTPRSADGGLPSEAQASESIINNGDVEAQRTGEDAGRGNRIESDCDAFSLEDSNHDDTELNKELDELNSFGKSEEAGQYVQASFFDSNGDTNQKKEKDTSYKYTYIEPKKELNVPHEFVRQVLLRGSGFENGRTRICKIFENEISASERVKLIKKEYGQGGAGWPIEGYGLHGYDSFHAQGLRFQWIDEEGEKEGYISWKSVESEIGVLILTGEYQPERIRLDEMAVEGTREDDEIIDAKYREAAAEDEADIIDEFAIPDEPESYANNRNREENTAVTMAAESPTVVPTDYAKVIAEMDEDMRDAMEILVTDCSCYTPFKPFLQDIVNTDLLFVPNKLDFLSEIALGEKEERKAYSNNKYGLVEYHLTPYEVAISFKNRNGERVTQSTGYRELYEVLTYMSKQPYYCGADQRERFDTMLKEEKSSLQPIYQRFLDKQEEIRTNREERQQRAKQNKWSDVSEQKVEKHNFHYNLWEVPKGGAKTRYQWNIDAITTLKQIESKNRLATIEEQKTLALYVGWGGLSQAFDENNESWKKEYVELKTLLSEDEYSAARATVNNAFYTSPEIASCMNQALVQFGFKGGNVLEPSVGIGNFFGNIPTTMQRSNLYGVELDSISGRIAKQLYQNANISVTGFEKTTFPDNFFDVVIGNVPFGDYKLFDPKYNKYNFRIHDYFIAKSLDQVRPGGMVAVITTKGTLDKSNPTIRKYIAERAELVGAIRLPNTAFKNNAGTEVTAGIPFASMMMRISIYMKH